MATSHQIIGAASDNDLLQRGIALGASLGIDRFAIERSWQQIVARTIEVDNIDTSVAVVHDYAVQIRAQAVAELPPSPGMNPAAVRDDMLLSALSILLPPQEG